MRRVYVNVKTNSQCEHGVPHFFNCAGPAMKNSANNLRQIPTVLQKTENTPLPNVEPAYSSNKKPSEIYFIVQKHPRNYTINFLNYLYSRTPRNAF